MYRQHSENSLRNNIDSGDFAAYVEREITGGPTPGQVERPKGVALEASETLNQIKSHPRKSLAGWIVALTSACTFASLAYLALTQGRIVLGGRRGMSAHEGLSSDFVGFALLVIAQISIWQLTAGTRFARSTAWAMAGLWAACVMWFVLSAIL